MRYPWANILIGAALAVSVVTGFLTLTSNHSPFLGDMHAAGSLAVVAVFWWKAWNIRGGLRRWRRRPASTVASIALAAVLVGLVVSGVYWSNVGPFSFLGLSGMTWHSVLAIPAVGLVLWHVLRRVYSMRPRYWADRRTFMRTAAAALGGLALWRIGEAAAPLLDLPAADRRFTGSYAAGDFTGQRLPPRHLALRQRPRPRRVGVAAPSRGPGRAPPSGSTTRARRATTTRSRPRWTAPAGGTRRSAGAASASTASSTGPVCPTRRRA